MIKALSDAEPASALFEKIECALLKYADKLTRDPASIRAADTDALRDVGLNDRGIHDACAIIAYYAFVNRIADGLGVELESP